MDCNNVNDVALIKEALYEADKITYSYQCPYLALADILGYISPYIVKSLPSQFSRISMRKMLLTSGIDPTLSLYVWELLEDGYTLKEIADII